MTPAEHYRIAERLLARKPTPTEIEVAQAHAHATLAAAGVAAMDLIGQLGDGEYRAWQAIGVGQ